MRLNKILEILDAILCVLVGSPPGAYQSNLQTAYLVDQAYRIRIVQ